LHFGTWEEEKQHSNETYHYQKSQA